MLLELLAAAAMPPADPPRILLHPGQPDCRRRDPNEIVVCGGNPAEAQRLRPLADADRYEPRAVRAETDVAGGKLSLHNESVTIGGVPSKRAMVTFSTPF